MANWLSIQAAAKKYGVSEELIRERIRLNYLTISSLKRDPFEDPDPLVDTDELDRALELKSIQSYPDDETIERIPRGHLDWIYQENSRLAKRNDDLREENYLHVQWEAKLKADLDKMIELTDRLNSLHQKIVEDYKSTLSSRFEIWPSFWHLLFSKKK